MRGLLSLKGIPTEKILEIIDRALQFKNGKSVRYPNKKMATLFFENSTRTLYSFHAAMINLGITPVPFDPAHSSLNKGETLYDTVKTFENIGMDGVVIRHSQDEYYKELTGIKNMPIFNGGDGSSDHPTQTLLDLLTIYEEFGRFEGLKVAIAGDIVHSRVAHSNTEIMRRLGMEVYICGPDCFIDATADCITLDEATRVADVIILLRVQFERHRLTMGMTVDDYHTKYGMTANRVSQMKPSAIIMHPAPVNRGVEIANEVVECKQSRINKQMQNGVYARMAVISMVLEGRL